MPIPSSLEKAKVIAAKRMAARKTGSKEDYNGYTVNYYENGNWSVTKDVNNPSPNGSPTDTLVREKADDSDSALAAGKAWIDSKTSSTKTSAITDISDGELKKLFNDHTSGNGNAESDEDSYTTDQILDEMESRGFNIEASVKTSASWQQDMAEGNGYGDGEAWWFEDRANRNFGNIQSFDGVCTWEVYDLDANASDPPFASGVAETVDEAKSKADSAMSSRTSNVKKDNKKEGNMTDTTVASRAEALKLAKVRVAAREAALARRTAVKGKVADKVDPTPSDPETESDAVDETIDVEEQVSVTQATDVNSEQVSEPTGTGGKDDFMGDDPTPSKNENGSNATIGFEPGSKSSTVKKASVAQISELTDLYLTAGILNKVDKYKKMAEFENLGINFVQDRISLLRLVNAAATKRTANSVRPVPPRVANPALSPQFTRNASLRTASDNSTDAILLMSLDN